MTLIANLGHDESWRYSGGQPGDQTGDEWEVRPWYSCPWNVVLRARSHALADEMATLARHAAENDMVGYSQGDRMSFCRRLVETLTWDPADIDDPCNSDCSAGVLAIVQAAGIRVGDEAAASVATDGWTGSMVGQLTAAGFDAIWDDAWTCSPDLLRAGDVLLNEGLHTTICITDGELYEREDGLMTEMPTMDCIIHPNDGTCDLQGAPYDGKTQWLLMGGRLHAFDNEVELNAVRGVRWVTGAALPEVRMDLWQLESLSRVLGRGDGFGRI